LNLPGLCGLGNDQGRIAAALIFAIESEPLLPALRTARTTTATTTAAGALLRLVHLQRSPVDIVAIQGLHGACSICTGHFYEAETARPTRVAIIDQRHGLNCSMLFEQCANRGLIH
jgi:hypothetical protein